MNTIDVVAAQTHFSSVDPCMSVELDRYLSSGTPLPMPVAKEEYFSRLVRGIVGQQISTKAAHSIYQKLGTLVSITPETIRTSDSLTLKAAGLSTNKVRSVKELAGVWPTLTVNLWIDQSNESIRKQLTPFFGIGVWTVDMFLLFAMARSDIFSVNDLGLRKRISQLYSVDSDDHGSIEAIADAWSPHRSVAALVLWHGLDNAPAL